MCFLMYLTYNTVVHSCSSSIIIYIYLKDLLIIYLFWAALGLSCGMWDFFEACRIYTVVRRLLSSCGMRVFLFSSCGMQAPGHVSSGVVARGLQLRHTSSVVVAHELSCSVACGILVLSPGI